MPESTGCASGDSVHTAGAADPLLSVILPNFNHSQYLPRALDALLGQDRPADEIIVVDDASTDHSLDVIARYRAMHPCVRLLINERNVGPIASLTKGSYVAIGRYIYFGAADDYVMPAFFATALAALEANPGAGTFCGDTELVDGESRNVLGVRPPIRPRLHAGVISPRRFASLLRHGDNYIVTGAAIFRRNAVAWAGGFDKKLGSLADGYLARKIALTYPTFYAPQTVLTWCIFSGSVSRASSTRAARARYLSQQVHSRIKSDPVFPTWYADKFVRRWHFSTARLGVLSDPVDRSLVMDMGAHSAADRLVIGLLLRNAGERAGRILILLWLWLRWQPFSATGLTLTASVRMWSKMMRSRKSLLAKRP